MSKRSLQLSRAAKGVRRADRFLMLLLSRAQVLAFRRWRGPYSHVRASAHQERRRAAMSIRARKFVGSIALLLLVFGWALLAMALAQSLLTDINGFVAAIYYIVAGLGWVLPAMPLISWMARPDRAQSCGRG